MKAKLTSVWNGKRMNSKAKGSIKYSFHAVVFFLVLSESQRQQGFFKQIATTGLHVFVCPFNVPEREPKGFIHTGTTPQRIVHWQMQRKRTIDHISTIQLHCSGVVGNLPSVFFKLTSTRLRAFQDRSEIIFHHTLNWKEKQEASVMLVLKSFGIKPVDKG